MISEEGLVYRRSLKKLKAVTIEIRNGRNFAVIYKDSKAHRLSVAREVLLAFKPIDRASSYIAVHKNGNTLDDRIGNLEWGCRKFPVIEWTEERMLKDWKNRVECKKNKIETITKTPLGRRPKK